jgi:putative acetyltransferase
MSTLELRPLEPADASAVYEIISDPGVARALDGTPLDSPHAFAERFVASCDQPWTERLGAFEDDVLVGFFEVARVSRARALHAAQITLAVSAREQRRGIGEALLVAGLDVCDRWLHLIRLDVEVLASAQGAHRLLARHGFQAEVRRRAALLVDGALADTVMFGRLRPGFTQAEGALAPRPPIPPRARRVPDSLVLRAASPNDAPALSRFSRDPSVLFGSTQVPTNSAAYWRRRLTGWAGSGAFTMVAEVGGEVIGCGNINGHELLRRRHVVTLGLSVIAPFQGLGIGDRMMAELLLHAEGRLGAERVELQVFADNDRAIRMYDKHAFVREGVLRADVWRDGGYADSLVMARFHPRRIAAADP